jgi:hypothetical protein
MPEVIRDWGLLKAHLKDVFLFGVPFVGAISLGFWFREPWAFWVGFGVAVPLGLVGFVRQYRRFNRFSCPRCDAVLRPENERRIGALRFPCTACDVIWDTGFTEGGD